MSGHRPRGEPDAVLGDCPGCGGRLPTDALLAQYETADGWPRILAECPGCASVVHPV